jgi:hypothetical protein
MSSLFASCSLAFQSTMAQNVLQCECMEYIGLNAAVLWSDFNAYS